VSLMQYPGAPSTLAAPDHSTFIQVELPGKGQRSAGATKTVGATVAKTATKRSATAPLATNIALNTVEWRRLVNQLGTLQQPKVSRKPSASAIRDAQPAPPAGGTGH
jgi:hypothetical protein